MQLYTIHTNSKRPAASNCFNPRHRNCPKVISLLVPKCFTIVRDAALTWGAREQPGVVGRSFTPSEQAPARRVLLGPARTVVCASAVPTGRPWPHRHHGAAQHSTSARMHSFGTHKFVWSSCRSMLWIRFRQVNLIPVDPSGKLRLIQKKGKEK